MLPRGRRLRLFVNGGLKSSDCQGSTRIMALWSLQRSFALLIWQRWSARRDNRNLQWRFVLGVLDAAGVRTEGFRVHPDRLKRELAVERQ